MWMYGAAFGGQREKIEKNVHQNGSIVADGISREGERERERERGTKRIESYLLTKREHRFTV